MVGFFGSVTNLISREALRQAVADSVPPGTEEINLKAFDCGYDYGLEKRQTVSIGQDLENQAVS